MMSINGASRNVEKIRRYVIPRRLEIETDDEGNVTLRWDNKVVKKISKNLWGNI